MEKTFLESVGERILAGRVRRDFSRKNLAERAGVPISSVIQMEKGIEAVNIEDAVKICNALEYSVEYILTGNCGMAEYFRLQQRILNLPNLNHRNLQKIATAFWSTVPKKDV